MARPIKSKNDFGGGMTPLSSLLTQQLIRLYRAHEALTVAYETAGTEEGQQLFHDELKALDYHFKTITGMLTVDQAKAFIEAIVAGTVKSGPVGGNANPDEWRFAVRRVAKEMGASDAPIVKAILGVGPLPKEFVSGVAKRP